MRCELGNGHRELGQSEANVRSREGSCPADTGRDTLSPAMRKAAQCHGGCNDIGFISKKDQLEMKTTLLGGRGRKTGDSAAFRR